MKKFIRVITCFCAMVIALNPLQIFALSTIGYNVSKKSLYVGETATITISISDKQGSLDANVSASGAVSSDTSKILTIPGAGNSYTIKVTAKSVGTGTISVSGFGLGTGSADDEPVINQTFTFTVTEKPKTDSNNNNTNNNANNNSNSSGGNSNTNNDIEKEKEANKPTAQELAAQELARRKQIPLISKIDFVNPDNSEQVYGTKTTEKDIFSYEFEGPKNVSSIKLNLTKIADNVTVTGSDLVEFGEIEFEKTVILSAVQDEVAQEIKVKVTRPVTATTTQQVDGVDTKIVDRDEADAFLKEFSFKREVYTDANGNESFYYTNDSVRVQLTKDTSNRAFWLLLDENNQVVREVVPVFSEASHTVSFLWEAPEEVQNEKHQNQSYAPHTFEVSESLQAIDPTLVFNTTVGAWKTENIKIEATGGQTEIGSPTAETDSDEVSDSPEQTPEAEANTDTSGENTDPVVGFLAYGMDSNGNEGFKYIDQVSNTSMAAFASFDIVDNFHRTWAYVATGVAGVVSVAFLAYFILERRKVKDLIQKHNSF
ncbi:hypothetical protein AOC36_04210 [Erysipelothrix larvae]|uniref:Uncharacterized protein n=1 Tax=Erysipelothrix larvae TaxID=1514105 RepID=A0A0X8GZC4_9FIRM|nr:hypothetical protein [Erysipelothrix larvae]AMC93202.1 hypothetical protein AOC36_04210 [Erysipelothrix larvae]